MSSMKPISAKEVQANSKRSLYPEPFKSMMNSRVKRKLGQYFGLTKFGINLTELLPGGMSAIKHHHSQQDEFIYILSGTPTLIYGEEEYLMNPGDCFGFKHGDNIGHQLINKSDSLVVYLEIGDRSADDKVVYPDDDLSAKFQQDGSWLFLHKDGTPY